MESDKKHLMTDTEKWMVEALKQAELAGSRDEVPVGAVIVHEGKMIAANGNRTRELSDPTAHAEILVIREACKLLNAQRILECELYVTLEPCAMCAAAIAFARLKTLVFAAEDPKGGGVLHGGRFFEQPTCHHKQIDIISGSMAAESAALLKGFFRDRRERD